MKASLEAAHTAASTVSFSSDPNGADIYIDGKFVGQTPATISVQPGSHVVVVKATGRKNWQRNLEVLRDSQVALRLCLSFRPHLPVSLDRLVGTCDINLRTHPSSTSECERFLEVNFEFGHS